MCSLDIHQQAAAADLMCHKSPEHLCLIPTQPPSWIAGCLEKLPTAAFRCTCENKVYNTWWKLQFSHANCTKCSFSFDKMCILILSFLFSCKNKRAIEAINQTVQSYIEALALCFDSTGTSDWPSSPMQKDESQWRSESHNVHTITSESLINGCDRSVGTRSTGCWTMWENSPAAICRDSHKLKLCSFLSLAS